MTEPEEVTAQLWLAHLHFWGGVFFGAMSVTSFAAFIHHMEKSGLIKPRLTVEDAITEAENALKGDR